jgi:hypothetical protein
MDSFNPFANAWGDDDSNATSGNAGLPSWGTSTATATTSTSNLSDEEGQTWGAAAAAASTPIAGPSFSRRLSDDGIPSWTPAAGAGAVHDYQASSSPTSSAPAAWSPQSPEEDKEHGWRSQDVQEDREADGSDDTTPLEEDDTGFDGFGAARLPDLRPPDGDGSAGQQQQLDTEDTDDRSWGETELPPSAWDERLNAKPTWESPSAKAEEEEQGWGGRNELEIYPPPVTEENEEQNPQTTSSGCVLILS